MSRSWCRTRLAFQSSHGPGHFQGERVEKGQFVKEKISTFIFLALTCPNDKARVSAFCLNFDICCVLVFTLFFSFSDSSDPAIAKSSEVVYIPVYFFLFLDHADEKAVVGNGGESERGRRRKEGV